MPNLCFWQHIAISFAYSHGDTIAMSACLMAVLLGSAPCEGKHRNLEWISNPIPTATVSSVVLGNMYSRQTILASSEGQTYGTDDAVEQGRIFVVAADLDG